jgi:hypothetical protein
VAAIDRAGESSGSSRREQYERAAALQEAGAATADAAAAASYLARDRRRGGHEVDGLGSTAPSPHSGRQVDAEFTLAPFYESGWQGLARGGISGKASQFCMMSLRHPLLAPPYCLLGDSSAPDVLYEAKLGGTAREAVSYKMVADEIFDRYDVDRSGGLTKAELVEAMEAIGIPPSSDRSPRRASAPVARYEAHVRIFPTGYRAATGRVRGAPRGDLGDERPHRNVLRR